MTLEQRVEALEKEIADIKKAAQVQTAVEVNIDSIIENAKQNLLANTRNSQGVGFGS